MSQDDYYMNFGKNPASGKADRTPAGRAARPEKAAFEADIAATLGYVPNALRVHEGADDAVRSLWAFARSAYLDSPLPSLFKERLFVHLSRYCPWPYCLARHAGFLMGRGGHPAGDPSAPSQPAEEVAALLSAPGRLQGAEFQAALARLAAMPGTGVPEPGSRAEAGIFAAATEVFLEPADAEAAREALATVLGPRDFDLLLAFLAFVRTVHHWTSTRRIAMDEDVVALLHDHEELARLIAQTPYADQSDVADRLHEEIAQLRRQRDERARAAGSAEMLRLALDAAGQGAWDHDLVTGIAVWDDKACELFGQPAGTALSCERVHDEIVHPDDRARTREALDAATDPRGDGRYAAEYRVILPGGKTRWLSVSGRTLFEGEGHERRPVRMLGTVRDVTGHVRSEHRLRKSEERLAAAIKGGRLGVHDYDPRSGRVDWDQTTRKLWGVPAGEPVTFETFKAGVHPDDLPIIEEALRAAFDPRDERGYAAEYRVINRQTGEVRWVRAEGEAAFEDGKAARLVGTVADITQQKRAEERLRESELRLKRLLDQIFAYVGVLTPEGIMLHANRAPLETAGITLEDLVNRPIEDTYPFAYDEDVQAQVRDAVRRAAAGEVVRYDFRARIAGDARLMVDFQIAPMRDDEGRIIGLIASGTDIDERVRVERAVRKSEELFRNTFENAAVGIGLMRQDGRWLRVNDRLCTISGYDQEELLGKTFRDISHPEDVEADAARFEAMFRGELRGYQMEKRYRRKNGEAVWVNVTRSLQRDSAGAPVHCITIIEDISGRKEAEEGLRRERETLKAIIDNIPVMITVYDPDANMLFLNRETERLLGWTSGDAQRIPLLKACFPDPDHRAKVKEFMEAGEGWMDTHMRTRDGRTLETSWANVRLSDGRRIGIGLDITERKAAEAALRESEEQFRLLADNMSQLAWMTDATGWIYWYNKRWFDFTGTTLEEMQGWGWTRVHHPDHANRVVKKFSESVLSGEPWEDTFPLRGKDGEYRWFLSRALPIRDAQGRVVRWFGTNTDITERLRSERHRELLINELNHRVKNTLAIVQGIARQTFRNDGPDLRKMTKTFQSRLAALAAAHNLLTRSNWEATTLRDLVCEVMAAACMPHPPIHVKGPEVRLRPKQAISFAMAFHELCTNTVKYGALSRDGGRIEVGWTVTENGSGTELKLTWREHGGPAVKPPKRRGFGLRMIEQALANELNGTAQMDFRPEGLVCTIEGTLERNGRNAGWLH
ncbi:MAG: PAS domain S-box protein [Alphaproteobacteria bacterium]